MRTRSRRRFSDLYRNAFFVAGLFAARAKKCMWRQGLRAVGNDSARTGPQCANKRAH
ncbi:hypothetical protein A33K_12921 [Burkholderia humptydooensis MSMB43]|uniref:Uncharacterized protein n=1 Tax=Burkholderia humptydooensis MSMB43 TaxID=441157 RepID=A0ABN0GAN5_9BURK|nr:hypothetical protein A33K_12921 [Burkholderia humptydooensis MSMB43]